MRLRFLFVVAFPCIAASGPSAAEIFRCVVDERVVYSDRPCGGQSTKVQVEAAPAVPPTQAQTLQREAGLGRVVVGMTPAQVQQAWGQPAEISSEDSGSGPNESWSYDRSGETTTVRFEGGKVAKISKVRSITPRAPAVAPVATQLTITEMEENERAQKANERRFLQPGMTQEEVRGKIGPPADRKILATRFGLADCWTYPPSPRDQQALTTLCFSTTDTRLVTIDRDIQR
jgi:hypothetical protein